MFVKPSLAALSCVALAVLLPSPAQATPSSGVTAQILFETTVPAMTGSAETGATDLTLRRIEIAPGGTTGWHYHDGPVYAFVESGVLTRTLDDCTTVVTAAGQAITENFGSDHVHIGSNLGEVPLVLLAFYTEPAGKPLSEDAPAVTC
jgi:quercetin dioxygenase-like cupin family protein